MTDTGPLKKPGFGLPIDHYESHEDELEKAAAHAVFPYPWTTGCVLIRELKLCEVIDRLTDKPDWHRKVFDDKIVAKWREEAMAYQANEEARGFSQQMFDFALEELRDKAKQHERTGIIRLYEVGPAIAKSDVAVSEQLRHDLIRAVKVLEDVPEQHKDWHPGSNEQVLDLVHPSLWPVVYGRTRALSTSSIGIGDALAAIGTGEIIAASETEQANDRDSLWSEKFQWLPAEVALTETGPEFTSYINNLHPGDHKDLYDLIQQVLGHAIPLWDEVLGSVRDDFGTNNLRFECRRAEYEYFEKTGIEVWRAMKREEKAREAAEADTTGESREDQNTDAKEEEVKDDGRYEFSDSDQEDEFNEYDFDSDHEPEFPRRRRRIIPPEAMSYEQYKLNFGARRCPVLREAYQEEGLQVIVKLANIHLTPEKPRYAGGSWHVEGMLNEMICATAIYYYDCENITDSYLAFRQGVDCEEMEMNAHAQDDYGGLETLFGVEQNTAGVQDVGKVLTRQGRLLAFPNMVQHQVSPFNLIDKTKPGHRKILAFFLVNPKARILSTANVPPQRKDWWEAELQKAKALDFMPAELQRQIVKGVDGFPFDLEEAKQLRLELMEERKTYTERVDDKVCEREFFCEH